MLGVQSLIAARPARSSVVRVRRPIGFGDMSVDVTTAGPARPPRLPGTPVYLELVAKYRHLGQLVDFFVQPGIDAGADRCSRSRRSRTTRTSVGCSMGYKGLHCHSKLAPWQIDGTQ